MIFPQSLGQLADNRDGAVPARLQEYPGTFENPRMGFSADVDDRFRAVDGTFVGRCRLLGPRSGEIGGSPRMPAFMGMTSAGATPSLLTAARRSKGTPAETSENLLVSARDSNV